MAGRFVRASKYRHIFGKSTRKEFCYDNLHISRNAWDTNLVKVNPEYVSVNWESSGGGSFAVIPLSERGKLPDQIPLFIGHTATVLDTDWNPFHDQVVASGSEDGKVFVWRVPDGFTLYSDAEEPPHVSPVGRLAGHTRKVGQVLFNPAAENILASASGDFTIKLWDISTGASPLTLKHSDIVQSLSWSANGALLVTTSRDKKIRVWDTRQQAAVHEHPGHQGAKNSRAVWMGEHNRIATTGFSRMSERQVGLWEPGRAEPIGGFTMLDSISGVCMPFWDDGSNCLYLAGKGDGNIRYYEYENDKFEYLNEYKSADPQRGIAFLPRRGVNLHENEVMRAYKTVNDTYIEPISFTVPRRAETFQSDIYPPATGLKPAVGADEWLEGRSGIPPKIDLESVYEGGAPVEVAADSKPAAAAAATPAATAIHSPLPADGGGAATPSAGPNHEHKSQAGPVTSPASAGGAARPPPPSMNDQKISVANMANRFKDDEEGKEEESAAFDEIPSGRAGRVLAKPPSPAAKTVPAPQQQQQPKPAPIATTHSPAALAAGSMATGAQSPTPAAAGSGETSLEEIKGLIEAQTKIITAQSDKISQLTGEVETLKRRVGSAGSQDQSERIRQLELELETLRS